MDAFALPRWAYVPGVDAAADRAALDPVKACVPAAFEQGVPASHPALAYGLRLNDAGFFWEAHEILEAVWQAAPKGGRDRIVLRGCIQVANANLKLKMGRLAAARRLYAEAEAEFAELGLRRGGDGADGFAARFPAAGMVRELQGIGLSTPHGPVRLVQVSS
ncbi:MAG: DUF309 domain-containing protein [Pseudomonadota bacterium]